MRVWDGPPEKPTTEEFDAWQKVGAWFDWQQHRISMSRGEYEIVYESGMPPMVNTSSGSSVLTDELADSLGFTIITDVQGNSIGFQR